MTRKRSSGEQHGRPTEPAARDARQSDAIRQSDATPQSDAIRQCDATRQPIDPADRRLCAPIESIEPTRRALRACRALGVRTIGDFLALDKERFVQVPNCGERTHRDLSAKVDRHLAERHDQPAPSALDMNRSLRSLVTNPRALRAFFRLGIQTVGEFLSTPRQELLAVRGFGTRTYQDIVELIRRAGLSTGPTLLPTSLTEFPVGSLGLPPELVDTLHGSGVSLLGDLLSLPEDHQLLSPADRHAVRAAIDGLVRVGLAAFCQDRSRHMDSFQEFLAELDSCLEPAQAEHLRQRVGIGCAPQGPAGVAAGGAGVEALERATRARLRAAAAPQIERLRGEVERELNAFEGVVTGRHLAPGSILHSAVNVSGDAMLPLRLVAFCYPDELHVHHGFLSDLPKPALHRLKSDLRRLTRHDRLPVALSDLEKKLGGVLPPNRRGLLLHVLREHLRLFVRIDADRGELVEGRRSSVVERLERIMAELRGPVALDDLMFHYRDHYRSCRRARLLDHLRPDTRFIEVEQDLWSLRERHVDELEMARVEAERMRDQILAEGCRQNVRELAEGEPLSERAVYMLIDILRREPSLRNLGRGDFCPRGETSTLLKSLTKTLRRAMGELPLSRFLQNQPERRRRVVARLLAKNRLFVSPARDRIDLLENYPFNQERMRRFIQTTEDCLEARSGYGTPDDVRQAIDAAELGGTFLTDHLLLDLLRRNGDYEILPGSLIARANLGLAGWIQHRTRDVLRAAQHALTPQQVLVEEPDLAEFQACIAELMERDPLVQTEDGLHYQIV